MIRPNRISITIATIVAACFAAPVHGQLNTPLEELDGVGIEQKLNAELPLGLKFRNSLGDRVTLGRYFEQGRPVLLSLTYSDCPMLCHLQLDGLVKGLREVELTPGEDFDIVNVSIDPNESVQRARITRQKHLELYGKKADAGGWHFLTGEEANIKALAEAVGFQYKFVPERNEYAHAAAVMVCTPGGRLSKYLQGVYFEPRTLRLAIVEAGNGKIGTALDQLVLFCFHYDAESGRYAPVARRIMQTGGVLTLIILLVGVAPYWVRRRRARVARRSGQHDAEQPLPLTAHE